MSSSEFGKWKPLLQPLSQLTSRDSRALAMPRDAEKAETDRPMRLCDGRTEFVKQMPYVDIEEARNWVHLRCHVQGNVRSNTLRTESLP